jgi:hypothetical protein
MCISCGCGEPNDRAHDCDITHADLEKASANAGIDPEKAREARDGGAGGS